MYCKCISNMCNISFEKQKSLLYFMCIIIMNTVPYVHNVQMSTTRKYQLSHIL